MSRPSAKNALITAAEASRVKFVVSGERDNLKRTAREQLEHAGWADELRQLCREHAADIGPDNLTYATLVKAVRDESLAKVPDHLKADFLRRIKTVLETPLDQTDNQTQQS